MTKKKKTVRERVISVLYYCSGYDGTVRVWNLPNKTHQFLQQTFIFNRGEDESGEDLDGHLLDNVCWSSTGKLVAGSMDNLINIWTIGGEITICGFLGTISCKFNWKTCLKSN